MASATSFLQLYKTSFLLRAYNFHFSVTEVALGLTFSVADFRQDRTCLRHELKVVTKPGNFYRYIKITGL